MSSPFQPSGMAPAFTTRTSASSVISRAITTSTGTRTRPVPSSRLQSSTRSISTSESPIEYPWATRNVNAIAPPTTIVSHRSRSASITASLSLTFEPPSTATNGCAGAWSRPDSTSTSRSSRIPAALGRIGGGPTIDACSRCDAPNASFT